MILNSHYVTTRKEIGEENMDKLTIANPVYYNNMKLGFSNRGVSSTIELFEEKDGKVYIPRNAPLAIAHLLDTLVDERSKGFPIKLESVIDLREDQKPAVQAVMEAGDGILQAGTGKGKSVMACEVIKRFGATTMILVHKEFLMDQFTGHLKNWLGLTDDEIGYCRGNPKTWTWKGRKVVIGMLQSIYSNIDDLPEEFTRYFGLVISDECHRVSANTWSKVIQLFPCWKRLGLTATPKRSDGLETVFHYHLGNTVYQLMGVNMKPKVYIVKTDVIEKDLGNIKVRGQINLSKLVSELAEHEERNRKILKFLFDASKAKRKIIVLSDRRGQAEFLKQSFDFNKKALGLDNVETRMYVGGLDKEVRREAEKNGDVLFGTFQMAKEGLDIPSLDTLFLVTPNSSAITVEQSLGRIARSEEGKKDPMVVDFVDTQIGICNALFNKRLKVYDNMKLEVK
jgi:superfamily II DNA or RNA helicase